MQSINLEIHLYEANEEIKCNNIVKPYKKMIQYDVPKKDKQI